MSEINEKEFEYKEAGAKLAKEFCSRVNSITYGNEFISAFVVGMLNEHRTLQQSAMRGIYKLIEGWAKAGELKHYDARNEATVHFCQNIKTLAEKDNVHFPFI